MTSTRPQVRRQMLDEDIVRDVGYGTISSGTTHGFVVATLGQGGDSANRFHNRYLYVPGFDAVANHVRRVREWIPERRQFEHDGPDYSLEALGTVEVHAYDPLDVNRAISRALARRCFSIQRDDIETNGQTLYTIGTAPFDVLASITESPDEQIFDVQQVLSPSGNYLRTIPWATGGRTFRGVLDNNVLTVQFDPAPSGTIRVIWKKPYTALSDETTTTACPLQYAVWGSYYELFMALEQRAMNAGESGAQYGRSKNVAEERYMREHRVALGEYAYRVKRVYRPAVFRSAPSHTLR